MQDNMRKFIAQPTVYPTNKPTTVTVIPLRYKYGFRDDNEYLVFLVPLSYSRKKEDNEPDAIVKPTQGKLVFEYTFEYECEYEIRFRLSNQKEPNKISAYALNDDLFALRPLKGDLHIHTNRSDGEDDPAESLANYRREGFDFAVVTDHNRYFPSNEVQEEYADIKIGLNIINGEEIHTPVTNLHIVHVGGKQSVTKYYVKQREKYEEEVNAIKTTLPEGEYQHRMAQALWATKKVHEYDGLAILPHPFWIQALYNSVYNVNLPFLEMLFKEGGFDAYELVGAMTTNGINLSTAYFNDLLQSGFKMPIVGSSDSHKTLNDPKMRFGKIYTIAFAKSNTREGVMEAVKKGMTAVVEHVPGDSDDSSEYRVYGSFRFVLYTRFLLENYFERTKEMFRPEGILMREYILGVEGAKEALELLSSRGEKFYETFFGRCNNPYYNTDESQKTYQKYNDIWNEYGVTLRGSLLDVDA